MRVLLCSEFYEPSRGGVQQVTRSIAEFLVARGHEVTVATTRLPGRDGRSINGVRIEEFAIAGNLTRGLEGGDEVARYQRFLVDFPGDAVLVNAAQQWTHDAALPVLDAIRARKVLLPCGFSSLHDPQSRDYFARLATVLGKWDHLVFHGSDYRDTRFARDLGLDRYSVIPNGADPGEFDVPADPGFRAGLGIGEDDVLFLSVGSPVASKRHADIAEAFCMMRGIGRPASLLLNGAWPQEVLGAEPPATVDIGWRQWWRATRRRAADRPRAGLPIGHWQRRARRQGRRIVLSNLPRDRLVQAYLAADMFVFSSQVECSPLVLFEAAASGTPFLSVPCGNAAEIAQWTGSGEIVPARTDALGMTSARPAALARAMAALARDPARLARYGANGRGAVAARFNWTAIGAMYEAVLAGG